MSSEPHQTDSNAWQASYYALSAGTDAQTYRDTIQNFKEHLHRDRPDDAKRFLPFDQTGPVEPQLKDFAERIAKANGMEPEAVLDGLQMQYKDFQNQSSAAGRAYAYETAMGQYRFVMLPKPEAIGPQDLQRVLAHEADHVNYVRQPEQDHAPEELAAEATSYSYTLMKDASPTSVADIHASNDSVTGRLANDNYDAGQSLYNYSLPPTAMQGLIDRTQNYLAAGGEPSLAKAQEIGQAVVTQYGPDPVTIIRERDAIEAMNEDLRTTGTVNLNDYGELGARIQNARQNYGNYVESKQSAPPQPAPAAASQTISNPLAAALSCSRIDLGAFQRCVSTDGIHRGDAETGAMARVATANEPGRDTGQGAVMGS